MTGRPQRETLLLPANCSLTLALGLTRVPVHWPVSLRTQHSTVTLQEHVCNSTIQIGSLDTTPGTFSQALTGSGGPIFAPGSFVLCCVVPSPQSLGTEYCVRGSQMPAIKRTPAAHTHATRQAGKLDKIATEQKKKEEKKAALSRRTSELLHLVYTTLISCTSTYRLPAPSQLVSLSYAMRRPFSQTEKRG